MDTSLLGIVYSALFSYNFCCIPPEADKIFHFKGTDMNREFICISEEVKAAIKEKKPVVALESAVISHGLPHPHNLRIALECEDIIRNQGAIPATVGIVKGALKVGLSKEEIELFASGKDIIKTNLGNLAAVCGSGLWGSTTVSTTLFAINKAGIEVFVTGGIGGVHRGFDKNFDISPDMTALERYSAIVVCAGVKSILDICATREHLETRGITVLGYQTSVFPTFFTPASPFAVDMEVKTPGEAAMIFRAKKDLGIESSVLVAVPIPLKDALSTGELEQALEEAEREMESTPHAKGRDLTPRLLERLRIITRGKSLDANESLLKNNTQIGVRIALIMQE